MTIDNLLPPHLAQFVREQLDSGRFQDEDELIRTALHLLEERSQSEDVVRAWLKQEADRGLSSRPAEPATRQFWDRLRDRLRAAER